MSMTKADIELAVEKSRASRLSLVNQVTKPFISSCWRKTVMSASGQLQTGGREKFGIVDAKYRQGAVSEFDKISAEVQMRSIKPNVIAADNAVTLAKLQLKVLMGITTDVDIKII